MLCVVSQRSLRRADLSSREVLPSVVCLCDREASIMRKPWPTEGCWAMGRVGGDLFHLVFAKVNERDFSCDEKFCVNFHYQIIIIIIIIIIKSMVPSRSIGCL